MHDASRRLQDCLADMYEPEWFGKEEMDALAEVRPALSRFHLQKPWKSSSGVQIIFTQTSFPLLSFPSSFVLANTLSFPSNACDSPSAPKEMIEKEMDNNLEVKGTGHGGLI